MSYLDVSAKVGRIYAQSLYELAEAQGKLGEVYDSLTQVNDLYEQSSEFRAFFRSPKIARPDKKKMLADALGDKISDLVLRTLGVMVDKGREAMLNNLVDAFAQYRDEAENRVHVFVTTAKALDDTTRDAIRQRIGTGTIQVELHEKVDPALLGGMRVRVRDYLVDNTLRTRLRRLRRHLDHHASVGI